MMIASDTPKSWAEFDKAPAKALAECAAGDRYMPVCPSCGDDVHRPPEWVSASGNEAPPWKCKCGWGGPYCAWERYPEYFMRRIYNKPSTAWYPITFSVLVTP